METVTHLVFVSSMPLFRHVRGGAGWAEASIPQDLTVSCAFLAKIPQCHDLTLPHCGLLPVGC